MLLDCLGIVATAIVRVFFKNEIERELLDRISSLYVFTDKIADKGRHRTTNCGKSVFSDNDLASKVFAMPSSIHDDTNNN